MTTKTTLTQVRQEAVDKIRTLRKYTLLTGFRTTRGQREILASLDGNDLAVVLQELDRD